MKLKILLLLLIAVISLQAHSQTSWSLEDCINYAHANNLQIKRTQLQSDIADNNYFQSKMNILPDLNAGLSRSYNYGRQIDPTTNDFISTNTFGDNYGINSNLNLFNGLQLYNNIKRAQFAMLASIQNVEKEKIEITFEIASAYLNILFQKELFEASESQKEVTQLQVDRTEKLVEAGSAARGDLLEIQAQLASEFLNVTNNQNAVNLAYLNLTQILDLDSVGGFEVVFPDTVQPDLLSPIVTPNMVYLEALTYLPHIKSSEYDLESYRRYLAIQKGKRSPQLYLSGRWNTRYSSNYYDETGTLYSYADQFDLNNNKSFTLGISVPIFNNWQVNNNISNAKIQVWDAEYSLDQVKQQLYKNIQQAYNDAVSAREKYNSATEAVNSYKESFHYTEQKYNVGIVNSVEYNIAKNNFIRAESELLQAKYEYIFGLKILDFYRGIPITL
jgi:outer membrane protein